MVPTLDNKFTGVGWIKARRPFGWRAGALRAPCNNNLVKPLSTGLSTNNHNELLIIVLNTMILYDSDFGKHIY